MFVTVRYADDRSELFNPDCRSCLLLSNIKERCDCDEDDIVDLSDETGLLKNLLSHPLEYATKYLTNREMLVLVKGEKTDGGDRMIFVPLLESLEADKEFLERLNPPPPKKEERNPSRNSPSKIHPAVAQGKRASLVPRPKQAPLQGRNALSPNMGRRASRARSQSVQLSHMPNLNLLRKNR